MTHWDDREVPVLLELWRCRETGDYPDWPALQEEIDAPVDGVLRTLGQRGLISGVMGTGQYLPRYGIDLTAKGIDRAEAVMAQHDPALVGRARAWLHEVVSTSGDVAAAARFLQWTHQQFLS
jgi:hypothetical protein